MILKVSLLIKFVLGIKSEHIFGGSPNFNRVVLEVQEELREKSHIIEDAERHEFPIAQVFIR